MGRPVEFIFAPRVGADMQARLHLIALLIAAAGEDGITAGEVRAACPNHTRGQVKTAFATLRDVGLAVRRVNERGLLPRRTYWRPPADPVRIGGQSPGSHYDTQNHSKPKCETKLDPQRRECLMCGNGFDSAWPGERVCRGCKTTVAWRQGGDVSVAVDG